MDKKRFILWQILIYSIGIILVYWRRLEDNIEFISWLNPIAFKLNNHLLILLLPFIMLVMIFFILNHSKLEKNEVARYFALAFLFSGLYWLAITDSIDSFGALIPGALGILFLIFSGFTYFSVKLRK